ncbi:MAG: hypothetical protein Fur0044_35560 [Anaerolineae bacterium]
MTADTPMTAKISMRTKLLPLAKFSLAESQHHLLRWLWIYRWASLLPLLWLFQTTAGSSTLLLLLLAVGSTLLLTILSRSFNYNLVEVVCFLGADLLGGAALLAFGGDAYYWYALSPLLLAALLFQTKGVVLASATFSMLYLSTLLFSNKAHLITDELDSLITQLAGFWLLPLLFGYVMARLKQESQARQDLAVTYADLSRRNAELTTNYHHLEIIHDWTLALQGAADIESVQQRILRAITEELGFSQAIIGLVNPSTQSLGEWRAQPPQEALLAAVASLPLTPENGLIARKLLDRQARWWFNEEPLVADEVFNDWLNQVPWLILPLLSQEQSTGVLLVAVEGGPGSLSEDQLVVLTAVASQAATALGTINRAQRLAAEQERNRIARDIHDTLAQSLFGMVFTLDACIKMLPRHAEAVQQELVELRQLTDQVRQEIRRYILDTWPSELTWEGFKADLDKYVTHFAPAHAFCIDFTINGNFDRLPSVIRRSLYRVSQEALANAARHATVDSARLTLHVEPNEVFLSISDRGKGFDPKVALAREVSREHFGLRGMRERVQGLGGTCDILSQVDQGTQILVRLPVKRGSKRG